MVDFLNGFRERLSPITHRRKILDEIDQQQQFITEIFYPSMDKVREAAATLSYTTPYSKSFLTSLSKYRLRGDWIENVMYLVSLSNLQLTVLKGLVPSRFSTMVGSDSISYLQVNMLSYLGNLDNFLDNLYITINTMISSETAKEGAAPFRPTRGEMEMLSKAASDALDFIPTVLKYQSESSFKNALNKLTSETVDEESTQLLQQKNGIDTLSIMRPNQFNSKYNPLFALGKWKAQFDVARYNRKKELRTDLELRLQWLRETREDIGDDHHKLNRAISKVEERITKLNKKIADFEERIEEPEIDWG